PAERPDAAGGKRAATLEAAARRHLGARVAVVVPGAEPAAGRDGLAKYPDVGRADHDRSPDLLGEGPLDRPVAAVPAQRRTHATAGGERPDIRRRGRLGRDDFLATLARERDLRPRRAAALPRGRLGNAVEAPAAGLANRDDRGEVAAVVHALDEVPGRAGRGRRQCP